MSETAPRTPQQLFERLDELGIKTQTTHHPPVFTVEEARLHRGEMLGTHIKNLFLRNKKKRMWLVVTEADQTIDLKALGKTIGAGHVSFGSKQRLLQYLGVQAGSVTPFALINDSQQQVSVVLDRSVLGSAPIYCHPLENTMTSAITADDLLKFIAACGHEVAIIDF